MYVLLCVCLYVSLYVCLCKSDAFRHPCTDCHQTSHTHEKIAGKRSFQSARLIRRAAQFSLPSFLFLALPRCHGVLLHCTAQWSSKNYTMGAFCSLHPRQNYTTRRTQNHSCSWAKFTSYGTRTRQRARLLQLAHARLATRRIQNHSCSWVTLLPYIVHVTCSKGRAL